MKVCSVCQRCFDDAVFSCIEHRDTELSSIRQGAPEMISGYYLERLADHDRLAETYLARHINSDRECLIKIFDGRSDRHEMFLRDAETVSSLFEPNVADIYATGALENGDLYVVTEQVSGRSLREILDERGTIELLAAVNIIRQTAEAVHTLHLKGIIHRAVRPENIIVSDGITVHLRNVDFGGLIEHSIVSDKFTIDASVNALRYFAPEQFSSKQTGFKSDVYSLGIVFYEMLTGHPPFRAETAAGLIEMHRTQRPADVTIDDFDLRMLISHTLMESLNKHPENRQSSANAFARQLRHVEQLATHVSTPPPAVHLPPRPIHTTEVPTAPQAAPEINEYVELTQISVVEPPTPQFTNTPIQTIPHEAGTAHGAVPADSRLNQFRRRLRRHRHEHVTDAVVQEKPPIEISLPEPIEDLPPVEAIEMPLQEIEVEAPIQALPTQLKQLESDEEVRPPTKIPEPLPARAIRQPKDIVITNPRKLGLRENFSTPPPKISHHEPDEITTVTARPIRIPIERTKLRRSQTVARTAIPNVSTDSSFFPALFGGSTAVASEERSSMFSGFYGETADRNSVVSQAIKIGGLVIAIASIVLIGKQFTGELRTEAAPVATNSARSVSDPAPQPIAEVQKETQRISLTTSVNSPPTAEKISTEPKPVKISTDTEPAKSRPSFSDDKTKSPADATRSKSSAEPRTSKPAKAEVAKTSTGSQPLTRTAKANPKPQALTRTTNKPIAQNKAGATTRPRIVANPRP